jgi:beta-glucosidase
MFKAYDLVAYNKLTGYGLPVEELPLSSHYTWGTATAAYQVEGGVSQGGNGPLIWDTFSHLEPSRTNGEDGNVACDHYNRVEDDIALMKELGVDVWTRTACRTPARCRRNRLFDVL